MSIVFIFQPFSLIFGGKKLQKFLANWEKKISDEVILLEIFYDKKSVINTEERYNINSIALSGIFLWNGICRISTKSTLIFKTFPIYLLLHVKVKFSKLKLIKSIFNELWAKIDGQIWLYSQLNMNLRRSIHRFTEAVMLLFATVTDFCFPCFQKYINVIKKY